MILKKLLEIGWVRFVIGFMTMYSLDVFWGFVSISTSDYGNRIGGALFGGIMIWAIRESPSETPDDLS